MIQYLLLERVIENLEKDVEILRLLNVWTVLNISHVVNNLVHHRLVQFHSSHCCVYQVQLFVKHRILLIHSCHQSSHVTENEGSDDSTGNDDE